MTELVQGVRYGLMAIGWLLSFGVGLMVLGLIASLLTALGDWLNGSEYADPADESEGDEQ